MLDKGLETVIMHFFNYKKMIQIFNNTKLKTKLRKSVYYLTLASYSSLTDIHYTKNCVGF